MLWYVTVTSRRRLEGFELHTFKSVSSKVAAILRQFKGELKFKVRNAKVFVTSVVVEFPENSSVFSDFYGDPYVNGEYDLVDLILAQPKDDRMKSLIFEVKSFMFKAQYKESKRLAKLCENLAFYEEKSLNLYGWGLNAQRHVEVLIRRLEELNGLVGALELEQILGQSGPYFDPQVICIVAEYFEQEAKWDVPIPIDIGEELKYYCATPPFWEDFRKVSKFQLQSLLSGKRISTTYALETIARSGTQVIRELLEFLNKRQLHQLYLCESTIYTSLR